MASLPRHDEHEICFQLTVSYAAWEDHLDRDLQDDQLATAGPHSGRRIPKHKYTISFPSHLFHVFRLLCQWGEWSAEAVIELMANVHISMQTANWLSYSALTVQVLLRTVTPLLESMPVCKSASDVETPTFITWILPELAVVSSISVILALFLRHNPAETAVLTTVLSLCLIECILPLTFVVSTALLMLQVISFGDAGITTFAVWILSAACARGVRHILYPRLSMDDDIPIRM